MNTKNVLESFMPTTPDQASTEITRESSIIINGKTSFTNY
jgi:hypothetical protein